MHKKEDTLIILSPAFAENESDEWLPAQEHFVRAINRTYPKLKIVILSIHFPIVKQKEYNWFGNQIVAFNGNLKGGLRKLSLNIKIWKKLNHIIKTQKTIGIFSFFCSDCAMLGHYFAATYSLKHYLWVLGQDAKKDNKYVRRIRPKPEEVVVISDFLQNTFEKSHGIKPVHVIPIGINPELYLPQQDEFRDIDIIGVGSFIPLKQYDLFIHLVSVLAKTIPHLKVKLVGDGQLEVELKTMVNKLQLEHLFSFEGRLNNRDVLKLMQRSKVLLHPSNYEGFVSVGLEALYAGAHVVSFCKPMNHTLAHWHNVQTIEQMEQKTLELLNDTTLAHSSQLPYKIDDMVQKIIKLYGYSEDNTLEIV